MRHPAPFLFPLVFAVACEHAPSAETAAKRGSAPARPRTEAPPGHDVYSLVDNRLYAHVERGGGLFIVPGAPGFPKYLPFGSGRVWRGHEIAGAAALSVPLTAAEAAPGRIVLGVTSKAEQKLVVNGIPRHLLVGTQTVTVETPLRDGENEVALASDQPVAIDWLQIGGAPSAAVPVLTDAARRALVLGDQVALTYHLAIPPGAQLAGSVAGAGCKVAVTATTADGARVTGTLSAESTRVDLGALAGQVARVRLAAEGCPSATLRSAALTLPGPAPTLAARTARPTNIVLWIMDSLRADKISAFATGAARPETPNFTALAARGTVFAAAYAPGNESRESYGSIWTGVYPANHGMTVPGQALDPALTTLAPALRAAGLRTVGATGNGYVAARWGFGDGWDAFTNRIHDEGSTLGDEIVGVGLESATATDRPFFFYLGTVDTHVSWRAKKPWMDRYDPRPYDGAWKNIALGRDVERMGAGTIEVGARDKEHIVALYDSNVSFQDDLLGKVAAELDARGDIMLVVTADHGDELWEDGRVGHGASLDETLVHVPLLVVYPPLFPAGKRVTEEVELVDLFPTLLDVAGARVPAAVQGASLVPLAQGIAAGYPHGAVATQLETSHALRLFGWKARVSAAAGLELYRLDADPEEKHNVAATRPLERRYLQDVLAMHLAHRKEWKKTRWGAVANVTAEMAADLEKP